MEAGEGENSVTSTEYTIHIATITDVHNGVWAGMVERWGSWEDGGEAN